MYIYLLHKSVYKYGEIYFKNTRKYIHKPKASENTSMSVKCHSHIVDKCNKLFIRLNLSLSKRSQEKQR